MSGLEQITATTGAFAAWQVLVRLRLEGLRATACSRYSAVPVTKEGAGHSENSLLSTYSQLRRKYRGSVDSSGGRELGEGVLHLQNSAIVDVAAVHFDPARRSKSQCGLPCPGASAALTRQRLLPVQVTGPGGSTAHFTSSPADVLFRDG